ncbi:hypothetical protein C0Q70_16107 [Pomacea canaliculata]|uniref:N-acetyltransferase domain-containing protein n=1 Tax=Pomacea canaliculata TaxID=400727 RepID=A0A2T7NNU8_POMCA|nr:hypothetical protein C0Q70_16107 [Pomacea canaliculata]
MTSAAPPDAQNPVSKGGAKRNRSKNPDVIATAAAAFIIDGSEPKRSRRSHSFSLNAAIELKAKCKDIKESKRSRKVQAHEDLLQSTAKSSKESVAETEGSISLLQDTLAPRTSMVKMPGRPVISLLQGPADEESIDFAPSENSDFSMSLQSSRSSSQPDFSLDDSQDSSSFLRQDTWNSLQQQKLDVLPPLLLMENEDEDDFEIDPASMSPVGLDTHHGIQNSSVIKEFITNITESALREVQGHMKVEDSAVARDSDNLSEVEEDEERNNDESEEENSGSERESNRLATAGKVPARSKRHFRMSKKEANADEEGEKAQENLRPMSLYEEVVLLRKLNSLTKARESAEEKEKPQNTEEERLCLSQRMLRRKLIVRKLKREHGLPVFDLDAAMAQWVRKNVDNNHTQQEPEEANSYSSTLVHHPYGYARFLKSYKEFDLQDHYTSFYTRLMGFDDDQRLPITSPYSMRVLKPFIFRDSAASPLRVQLLQEIIAHPHRNDPSWQPALPATLDYCYVRPQHIPSVNSMCRTFFWPGLDLSECLQYPDFSCVVMYKKLVVAFAFMVPDVKFNEAYISFIFTHPEWRGVGIAHFMLYHLIRTCMGKDVTLHVSVTNPAVLLYQKFGFKAEELCLDFYDKYFPVDSKECKHAFFMRLRR